MILYNDIDIITATVVNIINFLYVISNQDWDLEIWILICNFMYHLRHYDSEN